MLAGCGSQYLVLHPAGPVATDELRLMTTTSVLMAAVILLVLVLFAIALIRFRDRPGNRAPYTPNRGGSGRLEVVLFVIPVAIVAAIAVPTVQQTVSLGQVPLQPAPLVIDVTSLAWKWYFEYPSQRIATVNHIDIPAGRPVLFELTADSPMNAFWVPRLGGMEMAIPGRVLPLWLQADRPGDFHGRSANFSGTGFAHMTFAVRAVPAAQFARWTARVRRSAPPLTLAGYRRLLRPGTASVESFSAFPAGTFPVKTHGFTVDHGFYVDATGGRTQGGGS